MYEVAVERDFRASHAVAMGPTREPAHEHRWRVCVVVAGGALDADGVLCDFQLVQQALDRLLDRFRDRDLNRTPPFDRLNPTAENVARHVAEALAPALPGSVALSRVSVTEAPGCIATYRKEIQSW